MLMQALVGVVEQVGGVVLHTKPNGDTSIAKQGTPIQKGDYLTLLSGQAYIHMLEGFPQALSLNKPFVADGVSPMLSTASNQTVTEAVVEEAIANGMDPAEILALLEATAAGTTAMSAGSHYYMIDPMYGLGYVTAGYPTNPMFSSAAIDLLQVWLKPGEDQAGIAINPVNIIVQEDALSPLGNRESTAQTTTQTVDIRGLVTGGTRPIEFRFAEFTTKDSTLTSNGKPIILSSTGDNSILVGKILGGEGQQEEIIFTYTINNNTGTLTFNLIGHIDHPKGDGDDNEVLFLDISNSVNILVDGQVIASLPPGSIVTSIEDDVPIANEQSEGIRNGVEESGMSGVPNDLSIGNRPTPSTMESEDDEASGAGASSLAILFKGGADAPLTISIDTEINLNAVLPHLLSKGQAVTYTTDGTTLTAMAGDRVVFTLTVNGDGSWSFDLKDQLDHVTGDGENEELRTQNGESIGTVNNIDFTPIIKATDSDGDSITLKGGGKFTITVEDDVPIVNLEAPAIQAQVEEDGMSRDTGDLSEGNKDISGDSNDDDEVSGDKGSLTALFSPGADEPLKITLSRNEDDLSKLPKLLSKGGEVLYRIVDNDGNGVLQAYVAANGNDPERIVFTLTVNEDGSWVFDLKDQLDHTESDTLNSDPNDENFNLRTSSEEFSSVPHIDFSPILQATDFDGDTVTGAADGKFTIKIQDDIPIANTEAPAVQAKVEEDGMSRDTGDLSEGNKDISGDSNDDDEVSGGAGSLTSLFLSGADEELTISISETDLDKLPKLLSKGENVEYRINDGGNVIGYVAGDDGNRDVFILSVNGDGSWEFDLLDQLDHVDDGNNTENNSLRTQDGSSVPFIDFSLIIQATDFDGDTVKMPYAGKFTITVQDDIPIANVDAKPITATVYEDAMRAMDGDLSTGNNQNNLSNDKDEASGAAKSSSSLATLFSPGADEELKISLSQDTSGLPILFSKGKLVTYDVSDDGQTLTATADGRTVFTLQVSSTGAWEFDLQDQLDHIPGGGENSNLWIHNYPSIDFSSLIQATDADGDTVGGVGAGQFTIKVVDDVPIVTVTTNPEDQIRLNTQDDDTRGLFVQDSASASFSSAFTTTVSMGADEPGAGPLTVYSIDLFVANGTNSGLKSHGNTIYLFDTGTTIVGTTSSTNTSLAGIIFTVTVNPITSEVTLIQYQQLDHPAPGVSSNFADQELALPTQLIKLTATSTVIDNDGDKATHSASIDLGANIVFDDDGPKVTNKTAKGVVDEDGLSGGNPNGVNDVPGNATFASGSITVLFDSGADTPLTYSLNPDYASLTSQDLSSGGVELTYGVMGNTITAFANATPVFTFTVNANGTYNFTLLKPLDHAPGDNENDLVLNLGQMIKATDFDGDFALGNLAALQITVDDDTPIACIELKDGTLIAVDETPGKQAVESNNPPLLALGQTTVAYSALVNDTTSFGADGPAAGGGKTFDLVINGGNGANSGFVHSFSNLPIYLVEIGNVIYGKVGGIGLLDPIAFTVSVSPTGAVTLTQYLAIEHGNTNDHNDLSNGMTLNTLKLAVTATDRDGDSVTNEVDVGSRIKFYDDGPSIDVKLSIFSPLENFSLLNTQDAETLGGASDSATANFGQYFALNSSSFGADGPGTLALQFSLELFNPLPASGLKSDGDTIYLYNMNGVIKGSTSATQAGVDPSNTVFELSVNSNTGLVTLTQHMEIDHPVATSSNYSAEEVILNSGLIKLVYTGTITDSDGDTAVDTAFIDLGGNVRFDDDGPKVTVNVTNESGVVLTTFDKLTIGPNSDEDTSSVNFSGVFSSAPIYGADGPGTTIMSYALSITGPVVAGKVDSQMNSNGVDIYLWNKSGVIVGSTSLTSAGVFDTNTIFTIEVSSSGVVKLTQLQEIDHPAESPSGSPFDDQFVTLHNGLVRLTGTALTTDGDGDTATGSNFIDLGGNIRFGDDGPSITLKVEGESNVVLTTFDKLTIDSASDIDVSTANFSGVFTNTPNYGADGPGSVTMNYGLSITGTPIFGVVLSGLSSNGALIYLWNQSGVIVGSTSTTLAGITNGNTVFSIAVDSATGVVTLTQNKEIDHLPQIPSDAPFDDQFATLANGLVRLTGTATITDGDGDTATDTKFIDLGGNVRFGDDGPTVTVNVNGESNVLLTTFDEQTIGSASDFDVSTANFSGVFSTTPDYGADGPGSMGMTYGLSITGPVVSGRVDSLLDSNGASIYLWNVFGNIVGSTSTSIFGINPTNTVFTIEVNSSGVVTLTQYKEIDHASEFPNTAAPFDDQFAILQNGLVRLTGTAAIIDGDGDTATASNYIDLGGNIRFADHGPNVEAKPGQAAVILDESLSTANGGLNDGINPGTISAATIAALFATPNYGADGPGTLAYSLNATDNAPTGLYLSGAAILPANQILLDVISSTEIQGKVGGSGTLAFTIKIDAGTGEVTVTQHKPLEHTVDGNIAVAYDDAVTLQAIIKVVQTITDGDGDTDSATSLSGLDIKFEDDGPSVKVGGLISATVEEDGMSLFASPADLSEGNKQLPGDSNSDDEVSGIPNSLAALFNSGADAPLTFSLNPTLTGLPALLSKGENVTYSIMGDTLTASAGSREVFTLKVNADGSWNFDLKDQLDHVAQGGENSDLRLQGGGSVSFIDFGRMIIAKDADGDTVNGAQGAFRILVQDDVPSLDGTKLGPVPIAPTVDETNLAVNASANFGAFYNPAFVIGADEVGSIAYKLTLNGTNVDSGLYALDSSDTSAGDGDGIGRGTQITLSINPAGDTITGKANGEDYFTIKIDPVTGVVTFDQIKAIWHNDPANPNDQSALNTANNSDLQVLATAIDADGDQTAAAFNIGRGFFKINDDGPSVGTNLEIRLDDDTLANGILDGVGDDNPDATAVISGTLSHDFKQDGAGSLTWETTGNPAGFTYVKSGDNLLVQQNGQTVITVSLNPATGAYTVVHNKNILHETAQNENNQEFDLTYTVRDADGDTVQGKLHINVDDDTPVAYDICQTTTAVQGSDTNVMLILDVSSSMNGTPLATLKASAIELLNRYDDLGDIKVRIVTFSGSGNIIGAAWMDKAAAITAITGLTTSTGTNFDGALIKAIDAFDDAGKIGGANNVSYFLSDGNPTRNEDWPSIPGTQTNNGITGAEITAWENFVKGANPEALKIDSFALGMGNGVSLTNLEPIAYNGTLPDQRPAVLVDDIGDLTQVLVGTVTSANIVGNLLTDPSPTDAGFGADGGYIKSITINGVTYTFNGTNAIATTGMPTTGSNEPPVFDSNSHSLTITLSTGEKFIVDMDNGQYTYTPPVNLTNSIQRDVNFTLIDNDGDPASAKLTLKVNVPLLAPDDNDAKVFENALDTSAVGDLAPSLVTGTNPSSTGETDASNQLDATGGVGTKTYTLDGVTPSMDGSTTLAGTYGVIKLNADGSYTYTLTKPYTTSPSDNNGANTEENKESFTYKVTDANGNTATGKITVDIVDDVPTIAKTQANADPLTVDESNFAINHVGVNFADNFTTNFGADGAGTLTYALSVIAGPSGLVDSLTQSNVLLSMNGTTVEGRSATGNHLVFIVTVDNDGKVTLDQSRAVMHTPDSGENQSTTLSAENLVALTATITDKDGDKANAVINIGKALNFKDDAPCATPDTNSVNEGSSVTGFVLPNDTSGADGYPSTGGVVGVKAGNDTSTPVQTGVATVIAGTYGNLTLQANGSYSYQSTQSISSDKTDKFVYTIKDADGDMSTTTLTINVKNTAPPLVATDDDEVLVYEKALDTTVTGSDLAPSTFTGTLGTSSPLETDSSNSLSGNVTGGTPPYTYTLVGGDTLTTDTGDFGKIQINSTTGAYTYTLTKPFDSATADNGANTEQNQDFFFYKVTDSLGNSATAAIYIDIVDDVPTITLSGATIPTLTVDETSLATDAQASFAANFTAVVGADSVGAPGVTYSLAIASTGVDSGLDDTATGSNILLYMDGNDVVGRVGNSGGAVAFRVSVNGSGQVTLDQQRAIVHSNPNDPNDTECLSAANLIKLNAKITDGDGDTANASLNIGDKLFFKDDAPTTSANAGVQLDEDVLSGGNPGGSGDVDPSNATASGTLAFNFGEDKAAASNAIQWQTTGNPSGFTYQMNGSNLEILQGSTKVLTLTLNSTTGAYTVTLNNPIKHPDGLQENDQNFTVTYKVTDKDGDSATGTLNINVDDDTPTATNIVRNGMTTEGADTNLMLILDVSGSMGYEDGKGIHALINSTLELLEQYEALGNVRVRIVTFSDGASKVGSSWMTVDQAKEAVIGLTPDGYTNYDSALITAMSAFNDSGKLAGAQNVSYFISDGNPTASQDWPSISGSLNQNGIQSSEQAAWESFLQDTNGSTAGGEKIRSYALGMGVDVDESNLEPIAFDGVNNTNIDAIEVQNVDQLSSVLVNTVSASPISGNLFGSPGASYGADGAGYVKSIVINGITYTFNGTSSISTSGSATTGSNTLGSFGSDHVLTVTLSTGEKLMMDMDNGAYTFTPPLNISTDLTRVISYTVVDKDGDPATANLTFNVDFTGSASNSPLVARDDLILTNQKAASGKDVINVQAWALLANDTGGSGSPAITAVSDPDNSGEVTLVGTGATALVAFTEDSNNAKDGTYDDGDADPFGYTVTKGDQTATANVNIDREQEDESTLDGSFRNEILIGRSAADTIKGNEGNDVLIGLDGNDTLYGGDGDDILAGGNGSDTLDGGDGNDTATYIDAGSGVTVNLGTSGAQNTVGAGTDTLTSIENLRGSEFADNLTGNLGANRLDGGAGNDSLTGGAGDDVLIGGKGNDSMNGGDGNDVFIWQKGDDAGNPTDTIIGFNKNSDKLDLSDLLIGETNTVESLDQYLSFSSVNSGNDTKITIDADAGGASAAQQMIILAGVQMSTLGGTDAAAITTLLAANALITNG